MFYATKMPKMRLYGHFKKKVLEKIFLERNKSTDAMTARNGLSKMKDLTE